MKREKEGVARTISGCIQPGLLLHLIHRYHSFTGYSPRRTAGSRPGTFVGVREREKQRMGMRWMAVFAPRSHGDPRSGVEGEREAEKGMR